MLHHLEQYLTRPEVITQICKKFPNASGVPASIKVASLEQAVAELASKSYIKRKNDALISTGLQSLKDIENE